MPGQKASAAAPPARPPSAKGAMPDGDRPPAL